MDQEVTITNADEAEQTLVALLQWAQRANGPLAILLRRCLIRLRATPGPFH